MKDWISLVVFNLCVYARMFVKLYLKADTACNRDIKTELICLNHVEFLSDFPPSHQWAHRKLFQAPEVCRAWSESPQVRCSPGLLPVLVFLRLWSLTCVPCPGLDHSSVFLSSWGLVSGRYWWRKMKWAFALGLQPHLTSSLYWSCDVSLLSPKASEGPPTPPHPWTRGLSEELWRHDPESQHTTDGLEVRPSDGYMEILRASSLPSQADAFSNPLVLFWAVTGFNWIRSSGSDLLSFGPICEWPSVIERGQASPLWFFPTPILRILKNTDCHRESYLGRWEVLSFSPWPSKAGSCMGKYSPPWFLGSFQRDLGVSATFSHAGSRRRSGIWQRP